MAATIKCDTIVTTGGSPNNITMDTAGNVTIGNNHTVNGAVSVGGNETVAGTVSMGHSFKRNKLINGNMVIDQRNAGASLTNVANTPTYTVDRWAYYATQASKISIQQNAGSVTPPTGFTNYLGVTSLSSYAVLSSDIFRLHQIIEGFNIADLAWGTSSAKTVTLSFWVRSSLTGTFGGSLFNGSANRSYPFTYSISSSNTWTQISITISGDTSGTWNTNNTAGLYVNFGLGCGSTFSGTAGTWSSTEYDSATGATSVVGTNGATFYVTGVQLETGSIATPYERQIYSDQLAQCQRYYYQVVKGMNGASPWPITVGFWLTNTTINANIMLPVTMRSAPTVSVVTGSDYYRFYWNNTNTSATTVLTTFILDISSTTFAYLNTTSTGGTGGMAGNFSSWNSAASLAMNAEL